LCLDRPIRAARVLGRIEVGVPLDEKLIEDLGLLVELLVELVQALRRRLKGLLQPFSDINRK